MNKPVNFEIAKLLKEKGFDSKNPIAEYWNIEEKQWLIEPWEDEYDSLHHEDSPDDFVFLCSAPTLAEVVMWLYEKHKIWIHCEICFDGNSFIPKITKVVENLYPFDTQFKSPTEAYEAAIKYTLENKI